MRRGMRRGRRVKPTTTSVLPADQDGTKEQTEPPLSVLFAANLSGAAEPLEDDLFNEDLLKDEVLPARQKSIEHDTRARYTAVLEKRLKDNPRLLEAFESFNVDEILNVLGCAKSRSTEVPPQAAGGGESGGGDQPMNDIAERVAKLEALFPTLASKEDLGSLRADIGALSTKLDTEVGRLSTEVVKLDASIGKLEGKLDEGISKLSTRIDVEVGKLSPEVARLSTEVGRLDGTLGATLPHLATEAALHKAIHKQTILLIGCTAALVTAVFFIARLPPPLPESTPSTTNQAVPAEKLAAPAPASVPDPAS